MLESAEEIQISSKRPDGIPDQSPCSTNGCFGERTWNEELRLKFRRESVYLVFIFPGVVCPSCHYRAVPSEVAKQITSIGLEKLVKAGIVPIRRPTINGGRDNSSNTSK